MARNWIVVGDKLAGGGWVVSSGATTDIDGCLVCRVGDKCICAIHGETMIASGDPTVIIDGAFLARHGDKCACGCTLISTRQNRVFVEDMYPDGGSQMFDVGAAMAAIGGAQSVVPSSPPPPERSEGNAGQAGDEGAKDAEQDGPMPSVSAKGSADATDVALVEAELAKIPPEYRQKMADNGVEVVVVRGSVTDYYTELQGVQPRGWPPGETWDDVPGMCRDKTVVIATRGHGTAAGAHVPSTGDGHGSYNLVMHESAHALQNITGGSPEFVAARTADANALNAYQKQAGEAGLQETFAESFANVFGGNPGYENTHPNLYDFWSKGP